MRFVIGAIRLPAGLGVLVVSLLAIAALFGFAVPQLDLLNHLQLPLFTSAVLGVGLTVLLFLRSRWQRPLLALSVAGLIASSLTFVPEFLAGYAPREALPSDGRPVFKLMTHNVFGLNYDMERVDAVIDAEDPDIIALQEYFGEQATELHPLLRASYPYFVHCHGGKRANLGLYSKIPFDTGMGEGDCPANAYGTQRTAHILAKFRLADGTEFSVLTSHMDWPLPVERQREELRALAEAANAVSGPLIVVGDFNSTPWSYALRGFAAETGLERQSRNLITYPLLFTVPYRIDPRGLIDTVPFLPLDHVFTRDFITVHELHRGPATGSDHLPVIFSFSILPEPLRPANR